MMADARAIADMFNEIEVGSSDYTSRTDEKELRPFEARVEDVQAVMDNEMPFEDDIIESAVQAASDNSDYESEVEKDMKEFEVEEPIEKVTEEPVAEEPVAEEPVRNLVEVDAPEVEEEIPNKKNEIADKNPLGLSALDLQAYNTIRSQLPQFTLYDGSMSFKDFYRYKFMILRNAVGRFTILNLKQMGEEIGNIKLDHFIGDRAISPELLRRRLDDAYRYRARLSSLMIKLFEQLPWWERECEMLRAKLWKDHELKGAHRRDGLTMEHMADVEDYLHYMKGVMDAAKHTDSMLRAATESLSRQLSCLQIKEATGFSTKMETSQVESRVEQNVVPEVEQNFVPESSVLDDLDSLESNSVVEAPGASNNAESILSLDDDDELANL